MDSPPENWKGAALASDAPRNSGNPDNASIANAGGKNKATLPKVTRLPPGRAEGCDDLTTWASYRRGGRSGLPCSESPHAKAKGYSAHLEVLADGWLARHGRGRR
jgi:hypothetical protein